jgi:hypothetical protein
MATPRRTAATPSGSGARGRRSCQQVPFQSMVM